MLPPHLAAPVGRRDQGVLGTSVLNHFLFTMDYAHGALILRRKTQTQLQQLEAQAKGAITTPFWMAGHHFMVAWGTFDRLGPMLFFIDTGGKNAGFLPAQSTLAAAGVKLDRSKAHRVIAGVTPRGPRFVTVIPFRVNRLTLGPAIRCDLPGSAGAFPPQIESEFGFHIGGLISHAFFRPFAVTFDFLDMRLFLSAAAPSCGTGR